MNRSISSVLHNSRIVVYDSFLCGMKWSTQILLQVTPSRSSIPYIPQLLALCCSVCEVHICSKKSLFAYNDDRSILLATTVYASLAPSSTYRGSPFAYSRFLLFFPIHPHRQLTGHAMVRNILSAERSTVLSIPFCSDVHWSWLSIHSMLRSPVCVAYIRLVIVILIFLHDNDGSVLLPGR